MRPAAPLALALALAACVSRAPEPPRASSARPPAATAEGGYLVRPGDTLSGIAARLGVEMTALARANALAPPYLIRVGQRLTIPARSTPVQRSESRAVVQPLPRTAPAPTPSPSFIASGAPRLTWPADGPLAERFGQGDGRGIAIAAHAGAAVRAASAGTVLFAGDEPARYGRLVLVDHGGGWVSAYGHLSRIVVSEGEAVRSGARVGFVGPPNLHFELRRDNAPIDPVPLLPPRF
jgi:lipoprotein NlpD